MITIIATIKITSDDSTNSTSQEIDIDRRNLISFSRDLFDRGDIKKPNYGIISNVGNLIFKDVEGDIARYIENGMAELDLSVLAYVYNTLTKTKEQICDFKTSSLDYDNDNRSVTISLKDDLEEWQSIDVEGINYDVRYSKQENMEYYYSYLRAKTPLKHKMQFFEDLDDNTRYILQNTKVNYPFLSSGNLWQQWNKLCTVCGLYIYKENGTTVCKSDYGN